MSDKYPIQPCSPTAAAKISPDATDIVGTSTRSREKYPFSDLVIGTAFAVPMAEITNETSFRVTVSVRGKKLGKKFAVVKHADVNLWEVARIG